MKVEDVIVVLPRRLPHIVVSLGVIVLPNWQHVQLATRTGNLIKPVLIERLYGSACRNIRQIPPKAVITWQVVVVSGRYRHGQTSRSQQCHNTAFYDRDLKYA